VADASDFDEGAEITVGSERTFISHKSGNRLFYAPFLVNLAPISATVTRLAVNNVYIDDRKLLLDRDYTIDATTAELTLDPLAEVNVASVRAVTGTVTFSSGSRAVTGTNTIFDQELRSGDWIRLIGNVDYFEILSIESATALTLRTNATYSGINLSSRYKSPNYYTEGETILSCDTLGKTEDGLSTGALIKTAADIVLDILSDVSSSDIDTASFTLAAELAPQTLGLVIPTNVSDKKTPNAREVISNINKSVFGSLVQTADFALKYNILSPKRSQSATRFSEKDVLSFKITTDSSRIVKTTRINFKKREFNPMALKSTFEQSVSISASGQYLVETDKEFELDTLLVEETPARLHAQRFSFFFSIASSVVQLDTKLKASRMEVNDKVSIEHEKFYERIGSTDKRKVAAVQALKKSIFDSSIALEDLSNAFSRCGVITENDHDNYDDSSAEERAFAGFITDPFGMQGNDPETWGVSLIW
jgi:hypothetical protein